MNTELGVLRAGGTFEKPRRTDETILEPDSPVAVGFGYAAVTRDGIPMYEAPVGELRADFTVRDAETMAAREPSRDWRIHLVAQLDERHYRRDPDGRWKIYRRGYGLS